MIHGWWVTRALENGGAIYLGAWCFWVILSITFHELAHGWAAIARGDMGMDRICYDFNSYRPRCGRGQPCINS